jgi:hypothetical protein
MAVTRRLAWAATSCLLLVASGCGDGDSDSDSAESSGPEDRSRACDALEELDPTVDRIAGTGSDSDADTTVAELEEALDDFGSELEQLQNEDTDLPPRLESGLQSAASALRSAVDSLASDEVLSEAGEAVTSARSAIGRAWTSLLESLDCSTA